VADQSAAASGRSDLSSEATTEASHQSTATDINVHVAWFMDRRLRFTGRKRSLNKFSIISTRASDVLDAYLHMSIQVSKQATCLTPVGKQSRRLWHESCMHVMRCVHMYHCTVHTPDVG
jgi:translation elongation factor EF-Ts